MYLHLGNNELILMENVVGIFDIDNTSTSKITRRYLSDAQKNGEIITVGQDIPKSFVVTVDGGKTRVYISQISSQTLKKRARDAGGIMNIG